MSWKESHLQIERFFPDSSWYLGWSCFSSFPLSQSLWPESNKKYVDGTQSSHKAVIKPVAGSVRYVDFNGDESRLSLNKKLTWITGPVENVTHIHQMTLLDHVSQIYLIEDSQFTSCRWNFDYLDDWALIESNKSIRAVRKVVEKVNLFQSEVASDPFELQPSHRVPNT